VWPEYCETTATGSIHSYISSSDDECEGVTITLPVFSVMQSITDVHNTCVCALYTCMIVLAMWCNMDIDIGNGT